MAICSCARLDDAKHSLYNTLQMSRGQTCRHPFYMQVLHVFTSAVKVAEEKKSLKVLNCCKHFVFDLFLFGRNVYLLQQHSFFCLYSPSHSDQHFAWAPKNVNLYPDCPYLLFIMFTLMLVSALFKLIYSLNAVKKKRSSVFFTFFLLKGIIVPSQSLAHADLVFYFRTCTVWYVKNLILCCACWIHTLLRCYCHNVIVRLAALLLVTSCFICFNLHSTFTFVIIKPVKF